VNEAAEVVTGAADTNANIIFGAVIDENLAGRVRVTVIATGFDRSLRRERRDRPAEEPQREPASSERFELPADVLEVPSFLRRR
jgi:cell division protein FtsZ